LKDVKEFFSYKDISGFCFFITDLINIFEKHEFIKQPAIFDITGRIKIFSIILPKKQLYKNFWFPEAESVLIISPFLFFIVKFSPFVIL